MTCNDNIQSKLEMLFTQPATAFVPVSALKTTQQLCYWNIQTHVCVRVCLCVFCCVCNRNFTFT